MLTKKDAERPLRMLNIEQVWPVLSREALAYLELKQDPTFPYLPQDEIKPYIQQAIAYGEQTAHKQTSFSHSKEFLNHLLKQRLCIRFPKQHPQDPQIRAQYTPRPPTIEIFQNSIDQLHLFFTNTLTRVSNDDLIRLHLYHEWFHHLEQKEIPRTDHYLNKCKIKEWGPFTIKKRLIMLREIAAHAFAQTQMQLDWSPLLLDRLINYHKQDWEAARIREQFAKIKNEFAGLGTTEEPTESLSD